MCTYNKCLIICILHVRENIVFVFWVWFTLINMTVLSSINFPANDIFFLYNTTYYFCVILHTHTYAHIHAHTHASTTSLFYSSPVFLLWRSYSSAGLKLLPPRLECWAAYLSDFCVDGHLAWFYTGLLWRVHIVAQLRCYYRSHTHTHTRCIKYLFLI